MQPDSLTSGIAERGREIYEREMRAKLERSASGKFLALDVNSGDYEVGDTLLDASNRLRKRRPDAAVFGQLIGSTSTYRFGGQRPVSSS